MRAISFRDIGKIFPDGSVALDGVTLDIPKGQFCVLLGPSGAGKSTLLRMVNGLAEPSHGEVLVGGTKVTAATLALIRPQIGMIHQQFNLVPRSSVALNVLAGALPATPAWRAILSLFPLHFRRRACELLAAVGLEELHLQRRVSELSGGQQQRVGIARAFMLDPQIVLADEPVASLDPRISRDILALLKQQSCESGTTVLCTLHQVELAREFADRIVALRNGKLVFDGTPAQFTQATASALYDGALAEDPLAKRRRLVAGERSA